MIYLYGVFILVTLISGWFILWKVPFINAKQDNNLQNKKISIIIPARNEENNLPVLLNSLNNQTLKPFEVLVIDDDSDDRTVEVAEEWGARVIRFPKNSMDWVGKSAACYYGAKVAQGDLFFFLDADIFLAKSSSLEEIVSEFYANNIKEVSVLSIQPYHVIKKLYENLSVVFNILVLAGMNRFSILEKRLQPAGAFGPSLFIDRKTYFNIGGHKKVQDSIMENIDLGKVLLNEGISVYLYGGKGNLHFRMYPEGYRSLAEGWSKSFFSGSKNTHPFILMGTGLWITGAFVSAIFIIYSMVTGKFILILLSFISYFIYYYQFVGMAKKAGDFHSWLLIFYPLLFGYFILLFTWSAINTHLFKRVSWKGREIRLKEEKHVD